MPSAPRAYWKGYLRLSLVSISVELYSATAAERHIPMHQIHKPSGKRVRYEKVVPGVGPIDSADIVKGVEVDEDTYVILSNDELDAIKLESKHTIELVQFVDHDDLDPRYFDKPYYLVPEGDVSEEGYLVIHAALKQARKIGIGQMTIRGRENLVAVKPCGRGLLLETLRYEDEIKKSDGFFDDLGSAKLDKEMVQLASELIERKSRSFNPSAFKDHYDDALKALVAQKRKGRVIVADDEPLDRAPGKVIDLIEALKRSVKTENRERAAKMTPKVRTAKSDHGERRASAKKTAKPRARRKATA